MMHRLCDIQVTRFPVHMNEFPHLKILADQSVLGDKFLHHFFSWIAARVPSFAHSSLDEMSH